MKYHPPSAIPCPRCNKTDVLESQGPCMRCCRFGVLYHCSDCLEYKPAIYFSKQFASENGKQPFCKEHSAIRQYKIRIKKTKDKQQEQLKERGQIFLKLSA